VQRNKAVKIIVWCRRGRTVYENCLCSCGRMFLTFTYKLRKKQGGICYTTKCDTVEDDLTKHASEGNPGR
jgi:hypothetical protein